jgi:hypothetical protein
MPSGDQSRSKQKNLPISTAFIYKPAMNTVHSSLSRREVTTRTAPAVAASFLGSAEAATF